MIQRALKRIKREMLASLDEWDCAKAAGLRRAAEILEEELEGHQERTTELIKKIKDGGGANGSESDLERETGMGSGD